MRLPTHLQNPNCSIYLREDFLTLDFETTNHEYGTATNPDNDIVLSVWSKLEREARRNYYQWGDEYSTTGLLENIQGASFLVAHNAKFEIQWLRRCGQRPEQLIVWDTQVAEYCIQGNRKAGLSLQETAKRYGLGSKGDTVSKLIHSGVCPSEIHRPWLLKYCIQDVLLAEAVFKAQRDWVLQNNPELLNVIYTRCLLTPVLADIEFNGVYLDEQRVQEEYYQTIKQYQELEQDLNDFSGGLNWNSGDQVAGFLYDELRFAEPKDWRGNPIRTPGGKRSASTEVIARLSPRNQRQRDFLGVYSKRNKLKAALDKNLEFFEGVTHEQSGVFQAQFNQTVTGTHRLSSSGKPRKFRRDMERGRAKPRSVQFQNLPRGYKRLFRARTPGWLIGECDGAQLEFRVAAFLGNDARAKEDIQNGVDVHSFTASVIGCTRQEAKGHTFKPLTVEALCSNT